VQTSCDQSLVGSPFTPFHLTTLGVQQWSCTPITEHSTAVDKMQLLLLLAFAALVATSVSAAGLDPDAPNAFRFADRAFVLTAHLSAENMVGSCDERYFSPYAVTSRTFQRSWITCARARFTALRCHLVSLRARMQLSRAARIRQRTRRRRRRRRPPPTVAARPPHRPSLLHSAFLSASFHKRRSPRAGVVFVFIIRQQSY
jgi:hypothetical protein